MLMESLKEFSAQIPSQGRLLGLDVGEKTIGLSLCDASRMIASPLDIIERVKLAKDLQELIRVVETHRVVGLIIGYPLNMDGTEGPKCQSVRQFARNIEPKIKLPMLRWDERMSTMAATRVMLEADLSRQRRGEIVDKLAASYILQGALDALKNNQMKQGS